MLEPSDVRALRSRMSNAKPHCRVCQIPATLVGAGIVMGGGPTDWGFYCDAHGAPQVKHGPLYLLIGKDSLTSPAKELPNEPTNTGQEAEVNAPSTVSTQQG